MTKTELYTKIKTDIEALKLEDEQAIMAIIDLYTKPKSGGTSRPEDNEAGQTFCRYTGEFYDYSEMVYQNQSMRDLGKHKGYSKEGISRWTKARAELAKNKNILGELGGKAISGEELTKKEKVSAAKAKDFVDNFDGNNFEFLKAY